MPDSTADKWNARYASSPGDIAPASTVLLKGLRWLPDSAVQCDEQTIDSSSDASDTEGNAETGTTMATDRRKAHDLACGRAGNAYLLAELGFCVSAWDISDTIIDQINQQRPLRIDHAEVRDISQQPPEPESFDVIVVSRFLDRSICPAISQALKPDGVLFYQTFVHGLSNPDFLLAPNELLSLFSELHILEYHEPAKDADGKAEARLIARRTGRTGT